MALENIGKKIYIINQFLKLISPEKKEIFFIYIYGVMAGVISQSLPLGIQSMISYVSSGQIVTSVIVLIGLIILGLLIAGGMQIMQMYLLEYIQQRLFIRIAFEFSSRVSQLQLENIREEYPPELMNRFFEVSTLQKGLSKLIIDISTALVQLVIGLIVISLYHPSFIIFSLILIVILFIVIRITGPKGLKTNLYVSKYKYKVAHWLQEIARSMILFRTSSSFSSKKTDQLVSTYIIARKKHFSILLIQYFSFLGFKTLIIGGLLIMGCILLINAQINLGQFIASEIIIILIMGALEKIILKIDTVYDVLTSTDKMTQVMELPVEESKGINIDKLDEQSHEGYAMELKNISYKYPTSSRLALKNISFKLKANEKVVVAGYNDSGRTTLINVLLGIYNDYEGGLTYNDISMRDINKQSFYNTIGYTSPEKLFDGSLIDNISLGRSHITIDRVVSIAKFLQLDTFINQLPNGFHSDLVGGGNLPDHIEKKIILARALIHQPKLLIIEGGFLQVDQKEKLRLVNALMNYSATTVLIFTNDSSILALAQRVLFMKEGDVVYDGLYDEKNINTFLVG